MENETRLERWLDRALARAQTPRGGATVIAAITTIATVGFGLLMTVGRPQEFHHARPGTLWWSVQTVTTVGYGDHVPTNVSGRLVAAFVMLLGLAFLAVITAAITSTFVARATEERTRRARVPAQRLSTTCARSTSGLTAWRPYCGNGLNNQILGAVEELANANRSRRRITDGRRA